MSSRRPRARPSPGVIGRLCLRGELDRLLAADDRHPDRRVRLLHRPRPHRHVLVRPELALVGEHLFGPGAGDDVVGFLEPGAQFGERHVVHLVFARDAAGKAGDQPALRQAVDHRQLFGEAQRLVQRQQIAVDQQLQILGALRRRGRHQIGAVHQPVRRAVVLVEPDPVVARICRAPPTRRDAPHRCASPCRGSKCLPASG